MSRAAALLDVTDHSNSTEWLDEQVDVSPISNHDRVAFQSWLLSCDSPVASDANVWTAIRVNWTAFLSATSLKPNAILAPNRKRIRWQTGPETNTEQQERFKDDRRTRRSIQHAVWRLFDNLEALTERWPKQARLVLNQLDGQSSMPLQTLMDAFRKQRRWNAVWTSFICFLLYSYDEDTLPEMGLELSEDLEHDIIDIEQALLVEGLPLKTDSSSGIIEDALQSFFARLITDTSATAKTNPLLWWVAVMIRSALSQDHNDDYISRGRFSSNLMPMDLDARVRLEAFSHYSKIILLDLAFNSWKPSQDWLDEILEELNQVDNTWIGNFGGVRPEQSLDRRKCDSLAWKDLLAHIQNTCGKFLDSNHTTVMRQVVQLTRDFS